MKYLLIFTVALGVTFAEGGILFSASYKKSVVPEIAKGGGSSSYGRGGVIKDAVTGGALNAAAKGFRPYNYPLKGNISSKAGTIEFKYKPMLPDFPASSKGTIFATMIRAKAGDPFYNGLSIGLNLKPGNKKYVWVIIKAQKRGGKVPQVYRLVELKNRQWYKFAVCWDKKKVALFIDGKMLGQIPRPENIIGGKLLKIGGAHEKDFAHGLIADVKIYDRSIYSTKVKRKQSNLIGKHAAFTPAVQRIHKQVITQSAFDYTVMMEGTADMDNTMTRAYKDKSFRIAFQSNISVSIENQGDNLIKNPRLISNDRGRWWSRESITAEAIRGCKTDQEKMLAIWDFLRKNRVHSHHFFSYGYSGDPVWMLNIEGQTLCGFVGQAALGLLDIAIPSDKHMSRLMNGHVMSEGFVNGKHRFLDCDVDAFYLDRENDSLVSGDEISRDHELGKREHSYGPNFRSWQQGETTVSLIGRDDRYRYDLVNYKKKLAGKKLRGSTVVSYDYIIAMNLRPDEKISYRWDNIGKYGSNNKLKKKALYWWGNSLLTFNPRLSKERIKADGISNNIVLAPGKGLSIGAGKKGSLIYEMQSPYVICGGMVEAIFTGADANDKFSVDFSHDAKTWIPAIWKASGAGQHKVKVSLDKQFPKLSKVPNYKYFIRFTLKSKKAKSAFLNNIQLTADLLVSPLALPRLKLGKNHIEYRDDSGAQARKMLITYKWQESDKQSPLAAPGKPIFPKDNSVVKKTVFKFKWPKIKNAKTYRISVSRYADMRLPYRPGYDLNVKTTTHGSPFAGMFSPDTDYYWRVKACNKAGLWSDWSPIWKFHWEGPRVPVKLSLKQDGIKTILHWQKNSRGKAPVAYDVYASNEKGFSISKQAYSMVVYGFKANKDDKEFGMTSKQQSNFLGRTSSSSMVVVDPASNKRNMNRTFYRVVAIDENGVESACSDYVKMPHPYIYSQAPKTASVNKLFRYETKILKSLGDLQWRTGQRPFTRFWEKEGYVFSLKGAPAWLKIDAKTGIVSGIPTQKGVFKAKIEVTNTFPCEVQKYHWKPKIKTSTASQSFKLVVKPTITQGEKR
jgi:concanavalin A-like lectin/glucanase superfamily protein/putative Ig domain-containing protein